MYEYNNILYIYNYIVYMYILYNIYVYVYAFIYKTNAEYAEQFKIILKLFFRCNILYNIFIK